MGEKIRLNSANSQESVNRDSFVKIELQNNTNILPVGEIENIVNVGEQFNKERQSSPYYRLTGTFNTLFNNALINNSTENSWRIFNTPKFRDITFPSNAQVISDLNQEEGDLTYKESVNKFLRENNGWFGYIDPNPENATLCTYIDMDPNRGNFTMWPKKSGSKNWELTVTYPVKVGNFPGDMFHPLIANGIQLVAVEQSIISGVNCLTFTTPIKHNLSIGETVRLKNLTANNGLYTVIRIGKDNGDLKEYVFSVEINDLVGIVNAGLPARMVRVVGSRESIYYLRRFKKVNVRDGGVIENDDYEIFPLAFSNTIYEDKVPKFVINEDIDVSDITDNLGRPLSELYISVIKTSSDGLFTNVKSGIKMPFIDEISNDKAIPDINRITNDIVNTHIALNNNVTINDDEFFGDIVEYNILEQREIILGDVYHRFNTVNREVDYQLVNVDFSGGTYQTGQRYEGYTYKAHYKIPIRQFSNYIEQGRFNTINRPKYSDNLQDGRWIWRDLLDIGVNDGQDHTLDYPFLNGAHYINSNFTLALKRQDPFGFYGLQHTSYPSDSVGIPLEDKIITKRSEDVC
jgi:hypothetical protein